MTSYPKAFEDWYQRHEHVQNLDHYQYGEYKRALFRAWQSGRRTQKKLAYVYGEVVRWNPL